MIKCGVNGVDWGSVIRKLLSSIARLVDKDDNVPIAWILLSNTEEAVEFWRLGLLKSVLDLLSAWTSRSKNSRGSVGFGDGVRFVDEWVEIETFGLGDDVRLVDVWEETETFGAGCVPGRFGSGPEYEKKGGVRQFQKKKRNVLKTFHVNVRIAKEIRRNQASSL